MILAVYAALIGSSCPAQAIESDIFVESMWQSQGCLLEVEIADLDTFELTLTYRADARRHPLRTFVRNIPGIELKATAATFKALEKEIYLLSYPTPSIDGDPRAMPDFVGRLVKYGFDAVVDEIGAPRFYTENDFRADEHLAKSDSVRRLLDRFDGNALAFLRDLFIRSKFVQEVFTDYSGVAVPSVHLRYAFGREIYVAMCEEGPCVVCNDIVGPCLGEESPMIRTLGNQKLSPADLAPQDALLTFLAHRTGSSPDFHR